MVEHSVSELYLVREREEEEVYVFVTLLDLSDLVRGRIFDRVRIESFNAEREGCTSGLFDGRTDKVEIQQDNRVR